MKKFNRFLQKFSAGRKAILIMCAVVGIMGSAFGLDRANVGSDPSYTQQNAPQCSSSAQCFNNNDGNKMCCSNGKWSTQ